MNVNDEYSILSQSARGLVQRGDYTTQCRAGTKPSGSLVAIAIITDMIHLDHVPGPAHTPKYYSYRAL